MILASPTAFFGRLRANVFDGWMAQSQVDGTNALIAAIPDAWPKSWAAYALATPVWETNHKMQPVREAYWLSEDWRKAHLRYYPFYGRGYPQLTWRTNYQFFSAIVGVDLVADPDKALDPTISAKILIHGMEFGTFTGRRLGDYLPPDGSVPTINGESAFYWCREIINGLDKASPIESIAEQILEAMKAA